MLTDLRVPLFGKLNNLVLVQGLMIPVCICRFAEKKMK